MITHLLIFTFFYWFLLYGVLQILLFLYIKQKHIVFKTIPDDEERIQRVRQTVESEGFKLKIITNPFGMGYALPFSKQVYITQKLIHSLSYDELLYIIHHEIGHIKYNHPNKQVFIFVCFLLVYVILAMIFNLNHILFPLLFSVMFSNIGRYIARIHEDEADEYAVRQVGFEKIKRGIIGLQKLYKTKYDSSPVYGYFSVHRSHLACVDRLRALSKV